MLHAFCIDAGTYSPETSHKYEVRWLMHIIYSIQALWCTCTLCHLGFVCIIELSKSRKLRGKNSCLAEENIWNDVGKEDLRWTFETCGEITWGLNCKWENIERWWFKALSKHFYNTEQSPKETWKQSWLEIYCVILRGRVYTNVKHRADRFGKTYLVIRSTVSASL